MSAGMIEVNRHESERRSSPRSEPAREPAGFPRAPR